MHECRREQGTEVFWERQEKIHETIFNLNNWTFANSGSGQLEAGDDPLLISPQRGGLFDGPMDGFTERFPRHGSTGLAGGRQHTMSPATRTALLHLCSEETVRQHHQIPHLAALVALDMVEALQHC